MIRKLKKYWTSMKNQVWVADIDAYLEDTQNGGYQTHTIKMNQKDLKTQGDIYEILLLDRIKERLQKI